MYLSQLILNPRSRQVQQEIANRYELHRTLTGAFKAGLPNDRILFRAETDLPDGCVRVLVQSQTQPDWSVLEKDRREPYLVQNSLPNPQVKEFDPAFQPGQQLIFRLLANPTARRKQPGESEGKRQGLMLEEDQVEWLKRKLAAVGAALQDFRVTDRGMVHGVQYKDGARHTLSLLAVQFDGILQVIDPSSFVASLVHGIGSGKGFGFGLLSLAPIE